jgi:hypothetical protein
MFRHTMINRSLLTGLVIGAATFPAAAQARYAEDPPASASASAAPLVSTPSVTTASQSGFQWGDAGIGAAGALLLVAIGSGTAVTVRRRSGPLAG